MKINKQTIFLICILVLCLFYACIPITYDYDLFARLIVGERIIEHGVFPYQDFLSYTPTHPWYDHEWGAGVIFYLILKYFGVFGFVLFYAFMFWGISFFVIKIQKLQKHAYPSSILFIIFFLTILAIQNHNLIRCQLISFFLFSVFLYILEKNRKNESNLIWLIPILTIFWNNVHGGVVAGLGLVFMYIIGAILERKPFLKQIAVLTVSSILLIVNPYGIKYFDFLFSATTMNRKFVVEWWPFYKVASSTFPAISLISLYFIGLFNQIKRKNFDITKFIVCSVTLIEGLIHVKLLSLCLITIAALYYNELCYSLNKLKTLLKKLEKCLFAAMIVVSLFFIPLSSPDSSRVDFTTLPYQEVEFLKINDINGNIVTPFALGSFVSYKRYPDNLIYLDGRYEEVYNNREFYIMGDFELADTEQWDNILKQYDTQIVMVFKHIPAYEKMLTQANWKHVFDGTLCGIFLREDMTKDKYKEPSKDVTYYRKNVFNSYFSNQNKTKYNY